MRSILTVTLLALAGGSLAAILLAAEPAPPAQPVAAAARKAPARRAEDERAIRQVVDRFAEAYNAKDAKALAALFTADAEIIDAEGQTFQGTPAIERVFAAGFQQHPQAQMKIDVQSIRFLSPNVAIEDGLSTVAREPDGPGEASRYSVVHVKEGTAWRMASARDLADDEARAVGELERLSWLVGNWVDESPEAVVKTSFQWSEDRNFLLGQFTMQVHGQTAMTGSERIGWDPLAKRLRSWVFDSQGGFAEGHWTRQGDTWILKLSGATRDGHVCSATNVYRRSGVDKYSFQSHDRVVGGRLTADTKETTVVREPPRPGNESR